MVAVQKIAETSPTAIERTLQTKTLATIGPKQIGEAAIAQNGFCMQSPSEMETAITSDRIWIVEKR